MVPTATSFSSVGLQKPSFLGLQFTQMTFCPTLNICALISGGARTAYGQKTETAEKTVNFLGQYAGARDGPVHFEGGQWPSWTVVARGPLWIGRGFWPTSRGRWTKSCWRATNIWPPKTVS